jgi:hypothetical protein
MRYNKEEVTGFWHIKYPEYQGYYSCVFSHISYLTEIQQSTHRCPRSTNITDNYPHIHNKYYSYLQINIHGYMGVLKYKLILCACPGFQHASVQLASA